MNVPTQDVEVRGVSYSYGRHPALCDISFSLGTGVTGLLGPNGAGKTTLLEILATARRAKRGSLELLGRDVATHAVGPLRAQIGYLPQSAGYPSQFTARDFVEYAAWLKGMSPKEARASAARALDGVGIRGKTSATRMGGLSGGTARRALIAGALVASPKLIILDEPTAGLDPSQRESFRDLIHTAGRESCVILSTHLVEDVVATADRLLIVHEGNLAFDGSLGDAATEGATVATADVERLYRSVIPQDGSTE